VILTKRLLSQETTEKIKKENIPVVIFGSGTVGEAVFYACVNAGIRVDCFCDNNINKTKHPICGLEIIYTPELKNKYKDAIFLISAADIKDVVEQLNSLGFSKWYSTSSFLRNFDIYQYEFSAPIDFVGYTVSTCLLCHDNYLNPDKLFLRSVDIIITERCSLKCRDCSNLMQYYKAPKDCTVVELMQSIDAFCAFTDEINEFRVIGGEPFMNKEFHLIARRLINEPKVKKVVFYTNGTIIPNDDQLKSLMHKKILIIITDYGSLSKKIAGLVQLLKQNNIAFYAPKAQGWTDCAKISKHCRNTQQLKKIFMDCCAKNLATLSDGKLYRCPFSANTDRLWAIPEQDNDYINILQNFERGIGVIEMKNRIRAFLLKKDFLKVCNYCNGRPFGSLEIPPAEQINKPLEYKQFN